MGQPPCPVSRHPAGAALDAGTLTYGSEILQPARLVKTLTKKQTGRAKLCGLVMKKESRRELKVFSLAAAATTIPQDGEHDHHQNRDEDNND